MTWWGAREPIEEDHTLQGQSLCSAGKIGADELAESFSIYPLGSASA
jgi:hypothetical protein